ncbi:hypothetical protein ACLKA7_005831 [Drosophila subpalustris]
MSSTSTEGSGSGSRSGSGSTTSSASSDVMTLTTTAASSWCAMPSSTRIRVVRLLRPHQRRLLVVPERSAAYGFAVRGGKEHGIGFFVSHVEQGGEAQLKGLRQLKMADILSILATFVIHLISGTTFFIHQKEHICPEATKIASITVYLSILYLFYEMQLIPSHWSHIPEVCKFFMELLVMLLLLEFGVIFIWGFVEIQSAQLLSALFDSDSSYKLIALNTWLMILSLITFILIGIKTKLHEKAYNIYREFKAKPIIESQSPGSGRPRRAVQKKPVNSILKKKAAK